MRVDLNADAGESVGACIVGDDAGLMRSVSSVSVAAGFHGGDPTILRATIRLARSAGVAVGAHPGLPDLAGFGRRDMALTPREAEDLVLYQIAAVAGVAAAEGVRLQHVKPHGALYNRAARDRELAAAIVRGVAAADRDLIVVGLSGSELLEAARAEGLATAAEVFADRAYQADGSLVPRDRPGALIVDPAAVVPRAIRMVRDGIVEAADGTLLPCGGETICVHGDTPGASALAAAIRTGLESAGIEVRSLRAVSS
jgi:UPF0271 protein